MKKTVTTLLACATLFANAQYLGHNSFADYDNALFGELMEDVELDLTYAELLADPNFWVTRPQEEDFDPSIKGSLDWYIKKKLDTKAGIADTDGDGILDIVEYMFATGNPLNDPGNADDEFDSKGYGTTFYAWRDPGRINAADVYPASSWPNGNGRLRLRSNRITGSTDISFRWEGSKDGVTFEDLIIDEEHPGDGEPVGDLVNGSVITKYFWWVTPENYQPYKSFRLVASITDPSWFDGNTWEFRTVPVSVWSLPWATTENFANWHRHFFRKTWYAQFDDQPGGRAAVIEQLKTGNYDSDGDGVSDYTEYAFGGSPVFPDPHLLGNPIKLVKGEGGQVEFSFTTNVAVGDIVLDLEESYDLNTWGPLQGAISEEPAPNSAGGMLPARDYRKFTVVPDPEFNFWRMKHGFDPFFTPNILGWWF